MKSENHTDSIFDLFDICSVMDSALGGFHQPLRKCLRIRSVISVNYHYIIVLCPFNLLIRFKCYNTV